ncbi:MAG: PadR family transcriptional regulator [Treponema sp.]|jgi:PadR family transcriptional regulator PadR|nr:PadR family transcriptional regulator [Treponema sp.]
MFSRSGAWIAEMCVLAAISSKGICGYELAGVNPLFASKATLYPILRRLPDRGHLTVSSEIHLARLRKIYSITPEGNRQLAQAKTEWFEFRDRVSRIIG